MAPKNFHTLLMKIAKLASGHGGHVTLRKDLSTDHWTLKAVLPEGRLWRCTGAEIVYTRWCGKLGTSHRNEQVATLLEYVEEGVVSRDGMALSPLV